MPRTLLPLVLLLLAPALTLAADKAPDAFEANKKLGRGVNFGNALEAPKEGEWGMTLKAEYFEAIAKAGFDSVRIPIKWSSHAESSAPYTIDPKFFERIDWAVDQALSRGLVAVVNIHHFDGLDADPEANLPRFVALWTQIAVHYKDRPHSLYFELDNEPHDKLTDDIWNRLFPKALAAVRESNPDRTVIVGPGHWNSVDNIDKLVLPESDRHLIATFHYYKPFEFTHQGAEWAKGADKWLGRTWTGTPEQSADLRRDFEKAAKWGKSHDRPLYLGEFGCYNKADDASRIAWTTAVCREADRLGISRCYWEFGAGFGVYDRDKGAWREGLLKAMLPEKK